MNLVIFFNLLGLDWPFEIIINRRSYDLAKEAVRQTNTKIEAIKMLRSISPEPLDLRTAKNMIDKVWDHIDSYKRSRY